MSITTNNITERKVGVVFLEKLAVVQLVRILLVFLYPEVDQLVTKTLSWILF